MIKVTTNLNKDKDLQVFCNSCSKRKNTSNNHYLDKVKELYQDKYNIEEKSLLKYKDSITMFL